MEEGQVLVNALELLGKIDKRIWFALFVAIAIFMLEVYLYSKRIIFNYTEKRLIRARELGHIIYAKRVTHYYKYNNDTNIRNRKYVQSYEYEINGKTYKYGLVTKNGLGPDNLYLYYINNPRRVFSEYDIAFADKLQWILFIIPVIAAYLMLRVLGVAQSDLEEIQQILYTPIK